jgi:hypothetical protein
LPPKTKARSVGRSAAGKAWNVAGGETVIK